jgi:hypothetical protein
MNSKLYILIVACIIGGIAAGYLTANNLFQNQVGTYEKQIQLKDATLNATAAQIQAKNSLIQSQLDQIDSQKTLLQANTDQINALKLEIEQLKALNKTQNDLIQLLLGSSTNP